jgi:hypothetical protein
LGERGREEERSKREREENRGQGALLHSLPGGAACKNKADIFLRGRVGRGGKGWGKGPTSQKT